MSRQVEAGARQHGYFNNTRRASTRRPSAPRPSRRRRVVSSDQSSCAIRLSTHYMLSARWRTSGNSLFLTDAE